MIYEAEFANGIASIVREEVTAFIAHNGRIINAIRDDSIQFTYDGDTTDLLQLKTVISVYCVVQFDIPRPKALLGHEHFYRLVNIIEGIMTEGAYNSLYLSAAGSDSSVMVRVKDELSQHLGLSVAENEGDLLLRMRRTPNTIQGWDILVRLTPRPLATRNWRVCNYHGAVNASVAQAMVRLTNPTPDDIFLNIACGSGTISIERALFPAKQVVGCDISRSALVCSQENTGASGQDNIGYVETDAIQMPFGTNTIDKLVADLPFGQVVGSHDENEWLYPAILADAARVAKQGAVFVIITHEISLMERVLDMQNSWSSQDVLKITLSGLHPRIYVLERL